MKSLASTASLKLDSSSTSTSSSVLISSEAEVTKEAARRRTVDGSRCLIFVVDRCSFEI